MSLPATMTAIAVRDGAGPADALHAVIADRPEPGPGQLLVRVRAAGVNRPDILQREGRYPPPSGAPSTLGLEIAGEVVRGAGRWKEGDRVCALLGGGGYAEYAVVDARHALPIPGDLDFVHAAAIPETAFTVYANVFEHGALKPAETLLVHGATSGIGVMAIRMAKAAGARVIATARGADKAAAAREVGADVAVDTTNEDFGAIAKAHGGIDVALDMVGAPYFAKTLDALNTGGRIVYIASQGGDMLEVPVWALMRKRAVLTGSTLRPRDADEKARLAGEVERVVWPWIESGRVRVVVDRTFPLAEAAQAHAWLESGRHTGKIVLVT
ncbi:NAD(P)H-quinone oxidoreductase [Cognatilysobacter terrigena]|uniref:NAD(P)H-quinone oxidoreductase n=1 Tax=Cognatilysobacter terrigena TaxID=2488749 RepID=UPI001AACE170|nr:NAD(P)H-quinone oxidoreductase [Lysobacter terrigena]